MSKALIVIDVQQGLFERENPVYNAEQVLGNINQLVDQAHKQGAPVIYVQHNNDKFLVKDSATWQLHPQMQPQEQDILVHKEHGNAFEKTGLDEILKANDVTQLVVTGLVTHGCVRATTLGGLKLKYEIILVNDGHSNTSKDAKNIIKKWNKTLGEKGAVVMEAGEVSFLTADARR
jgi:nicotinamidase-related amidase